MPMITSVIQAGIPPIAVDKLPSELRFSRGNREATAWVLECPPKLMRISWKTKTPRTTAGGKVVFDRKLLTFRIMKPWTYFMVAMNRLGGVKNTFIFFAHKRARSGKEHVFLPPMPNIYPDARVCMGTIRCALSDSETFESVQKRITALHDEFWLTPFTAEVWPESGYLIPGPFNGYLERGECLVSFFEIWQRLSDRPATKVPWKPFMARYRGRLHKILTLSEAVEYCLFHPKYVPVSHAT